MLLACTKNMSNLKESPRGSVNTQSFITMFMYLQNESGMFRDVMNRFVVWRSDHRGFREKRERETSLVDFFTSMFVSP